MKFNYKSVIIFLAIFATFSKQIRFLPGLSIFWNYSYYIMSFFLIFGLFTMLKRKKLNYLDLSVLCFNFFLLISAYISENIFLFLSIYMLPLSGYYLMRSHKIPVINIYKLLVFVSIIISIFTISEFFTENILSYKLFNYEEIDINRIQEGSIYGGGRYDKKIHPIMALIAPQYSLIERPMGPAMSPQTNGAMIAALLLFIMSHEKKIKTRFILIKIFLFIGLLSTLSGTGMLVFFIGLSLIKLKGRMKIITPLAIPFLVYVSLLSRGYKYNDFLFLFDYFKYVVSLSISNLKNFAASWGVIYGGNLSVTLDIDYLNFLYRFGIIGIMIFLFLLIFLFRYHNKLKRNPNYDSSLFVFLFAVLGANMHYDSIFRFPLSFIIFLIIGYISNEHISSIKLLKNARVKDVNYDQKI